MENEPLRCTCLKTLNTLCKMGWGVVGEIMICSMTLHDFFRGSHWLLLSRKNLFTLSFSIRNIICDMFLQLGIIQVLCLWLQVPGNIENCDEVSLK